MCINCLSVWILWFLPENVSTPRSSGMESHPATSALPHPAVYVLRLRSMPYSLLVTGGNPAVCDSHLPADNYGCRSGWTFHHLWNVPDTADTCRNLFSDIPCSLAVPMYHYPLVSDPRKRPPRSLFQLKMIRSKQKRHNYSIFDKFFNFFLKRFLLV